MWITIEKKELCSNTIISKRSKEKKTESEQYMLHRMWKDDNRIQSRQRSQNENNQKSNKMQGFNII